MTGRERNALDELGDALAHADYLIADAVAYAASILPRLKRDHRDPVAVAVALALEAIRTASERVEDELEGGS